MGFIKNGEMMQGENYITLILAILTAVSTLYLGIRQRKTEASRASAKNVLDISESWDKLRVALQEELRRVRESCDEREAEFAERLRLAENKLLETENVLAEFKRGEKQKIIAMEDHIKKLEAGVDALVEQLEKLGETPVFKRPNQEKPTT